MRNEQEKPYFRNSSKNLLAYITMAAINGSVVGTLYRPYLEALNKGESVVPWVITAAAIYWLGTIADTASTIQSMEAATRADGAGISHSVVETNPLLPDRPTRKDLLNGRGLTKDIAGELLGIALPPIGIALGILRMLAAANNTIVAKSFDREIARLKRLRRAMREPITNIEQARNILQTVVSTGKDSITPQTPTEQVAGFPFRRIRESIAVAGTDLINRCPVEEDDGSYALNKSFGRNENDATLTFSKLGRRKIVYDDDRYWSVELDTGSLHAEVPLQISASINAVSFTDDRAQYSRNRSTSDSSREPLSIREHRRLLRGMRWVCANILAWEKPGFIMANNLSTLYSK